MVCKGGLKQLKTYPHSVFSNMKMNLVHLSSYRVASKNAASWHACLHVNVAS